jgi:phage/plasmid-like protein (TIGR03299 family)
MPANVDSMFSVREMPWHGEGVILDSAPKTWDEAREAAGITWDVEERPLAEVSIAEDGAVTLGSVLDGWKRIVRNDNNETLYVAKDSYSLITIADMEILYEAVMGEEDHHFETGGSLEGGRKVWFLVELGDPIVLDGDPSAIRRYVAFRNSFDTDFAASAVSTSVRIVCANTWHAADLEARANQTTYQFRHSSGWRARLEKIAEEAKEAIKLSHKENDTLRAEAERMLAMRVTKDQEAAFFDEVVFTRSKEHELGPIAARNVQADRDRVRALYASPTCEGIQGTAWGLWNAYGEFLDHVRPAKSRDTHLNRCLMRKEPLKARGHKIAVHAGEGRL